MKLIKNETLIKTNQSEMTIFLFIVQFVLLKHEHVTSNIHVTILVDKTAMLFCLSATRILSIINA